MLGEPAEGSFYDPAFRQDVETGCGVAATDDFDLEAGKRQKGSYKIHIDSGPQGSFHLGKAKGVSKEWR